MRPRIHRAHGYEPTNKAMEAQAYIRRTLTILRGRVCREKSKPGMRRAFGGESARAARRRARHAGGAAAAAGGGAAAQLSPSCSLRREPHARVRES